MILSHVIKEVDLKNTLTNSAHFGGATLNSRTMVDGTNSRTFVEVKPGVEFEVIDQEEIEKHTKHTMGSQSVGSNVTPQMLMQKNQLQYLNEAQDESYYGDELQDNLEELDDYKGSPQF